MPLRFVLFFLFLSTVSFAKPSPEKSKTYLVYVNYESYSVRAYVLRDNGRTEAQNAFTYFWYGANAIQQTRGGFDGKLLHGEYKAFYLDNNLKEAGRFAKGLKTGQWKTWHAGGKLAEIIHFTKGLRNGKYESFDEQGRPVLLAHYRMGVLHGEMITYRDGKMVNKRQYDHGEDVVPKEKADSENKAGEAKRNKLKKKKTKDEPVTNAPSTDTTTTTAPTEKKSGREKLKKRFHKKSSDVSEQKPAKKLRQRKTEPATSSLF
jgi:antitoxin component YwqK of YwqJK toxin-antitoxin module